MRTPRTAGTRARRRRGLPSPAALAWAEDISGRCARATAIGSHSLLVENHTGIVVLAEDRVVLATRSGPLSVCGSALSLRDARRDCAIICGDIHRVELPCPGGDAPHER